MDNRRLGTEAVDKHELPTDLIVVNPFQPRKTFDPDELASLTASVRTHGILQPLLVRQAGSSFELIAGERRLRAAREIGLNTVPVHIINFNDQEMLEAALVENIQRSDLNPIEKAQGCKDYLDRYKMTHEQLAQRLGLARSTITNLVCLLELPPPVQDGVRIGQLSEAHAKILRGIKDPAKQLALFKQIVAMGLSVKATEQMWREQNGQQPEPERRPRPEPAEKTAHVRGIENELRQRFAIPVEIRLRDQEHGQIVLRFDSNDDFERILEILRK